MKALKCDILVIGGGPAGIPAALAAARNGARVILCQDRSVLGGNASSEIRMHIVGADCSGKRSEELSVEARESGIIEEIRLDASIHNSQRSPSVFDLILYDKCRSESNLRLMLNTRVWNVRKKGSRITHAMARRDSTEDEFEIEAKIFIDCTGDGGVGLAAGAHYREGRESRAMYNEDLALEVADNKRLGSSLMFQARKHDKPIPFTPPKWARKISEEDLHFRPHATPAMDMDLGLEYGYWWLEWGGTLDTVKDNEVIRDELLSILLGVWDHVKNGGDHGADNWALEWCGFLPGKRESRRFIGKYTLTQGDIQKAPKFKDTIAYGGWHMDLHPPEGVDAVDQEPCIQHPVPCLYEIPLRVCLSENVDNLMFAGRNISATHVAFASTRVMATCAVVGQGVGTAAALAVNRMVRPTDILRDEKLMKDIQQRLLRDGVFLPGILNEDPQDLARDACIRASSERMEGRAINVISGQTRSVHGESGVPSDRSNPGTHRWMSLTEDSFPAWIELSWQEPVSIQKVYLTFDTGLHRILTFSLADDYTKKMIWGEPQPETVRDYFIEYWNKDVWVKIVEETNNYQRLRNYDIKNVITDKLRITITATNGIDHARITEIRVY